MRADREWDGAAGENGIEGGGDMKGFCIEKMRRSVLATACDKYQRRPYICVALDVADQDLVTGATVADVGVDGDGAFCVAADEIREWGRRGGGSVGGGGGEVGGREGDLGGVETGVAGSASGRAEERVEHGGMVLGWGR